VSCFCSSAPRNFIVGGGVFAQAMTLPCSLAWETFKEANGARDLAQMRARILRYRNADRDDRTDFPIGCRILTQAFFKREEEWLPVPASWPIHTQTFKTYSTDSEDGQRLDAAHIRPYAEGGEHAVPNGLLLRRDIHCLFDLGYVTVTPDHVFEVSPRIREEFENGRDHYAMHGKSLLIPRRNELRPDTTALGWHNNYRFLG
jgi:putative restriction endonuclease